MFSQERRTIAFVIALVIILTSISASTSSVNLPRLRRHTFQLSSEVWSDDFENVTETLSEWTIDGYPFPEGGAYIPNITLSDGLLYSDGPGINFLMHDSTTAIGTWSVDLFLGESNYYDVRIVFMSPQWFDLFNSLEGYVFFIRTIMRPTHNETRYGLFYYVPDLSGAYAGGGTSGSFNVTHGWLHIDITRHSDERIYVYINDVLSFQAQFTRLNSSEYFRLVAHDHTIFDNVTVSDTIDIDRVPPHWTEPLINHTINYGEDFSHALSAYDSSGLDTWWINDTWLFELSDEQVVSSVVPLQVGNYGVEVYVNDTFGNVLSGAINIEVLPLPTNTTTPTDTSTGPDLLDPLRVSLFGAVGVVWVVIVLFIFRDYRNQKNA